MNAVLRSTLAPTPAMALLNDMQRAALAQATACLFRLDDAGHTVTRIEIGNGRPVLWLDARPNAPWIKGALYRRRVDNGVRITDRIASFHDCLVMWTETETLDQGATP